MRVSQRQVRGDHLVRGVHRPRTGLLRRVQPLLMSGQGQLVPLGAAHVSGVLQSAVDMPEVRESARARLRPMHVVRRRRSGLKALAAPAPHSLVLNGNGLE